MFLNSVFSSIEADAHRQHLLAQADRHRLVKLARAARRAARAGTRVTTHPPEPPQRPAPAQPGPVSAGNHDEKRRYAVSR